VTQATGSNRTLILKHTAGTLRILEEYHPFSIATTLATPCQTVILAFLILKKKKMKAPNGFTFCHSLLW